MNIIIAGTSLPFWERALLNSRAQHCTHRPFLHCAEFPLVVKTDLSYEPLGFDYLRDAAKDTEIQELWRRRKLSLTDEAWKELYDATDNKPEPKQQAVAQPAGAKRTEKARMPCLTQQPPKMPNDPKSKIVCSTVIGQVKLEPAWKNAQTGLFCAECAQRIMQQYAHQVGTGPAICMLNVESDTCVHFQGQRELEDSCYITLMAQHYRYARQISRAIMTHHTLVGMVAETAICT